jgi:hypothetical protein
VHVEFVAFCDEEKWMKINMPNQRTRDNNGNAKLNQYKENG